MSLRASVGSTEAAKDVVARVGVIDGPKRARVESNTLALFQAASTGDLGLRRLVTQLQVLRRQRR
jgi:hypothetical protein